MVAKTGHVGLRDYAAGLTLRVELPGGVEADVVLNRDDGIGQLVRVDGETFDPDDATAAAIAGCRVERRTIRFRITGGPHRIGLQDTAMLASRDGGDACGPPDLSSSIPLRDEETTDRPSVAVRPTCPLPPCATSLNAVQRVNADRMSDGQWLVLGRPLGPEHSPDERDRVAELVGADGQAWE
jgi:hypothetical protein